MNFTDFFNTPEGMIVAMFALALLAVLVVYVANLLIANNLFGLLPDDSPLAPIVDEGLDQGSEALQRSLILNAFALALKTETPIDEDVLKVLIKHMGWAIEQTEGGNGEIKLTLTKLPPPADS
jgi:hypothetical protein